MVKSFNVGPLLAGDLNAGPTSWTPVLTATNTNPNLGSGGNFLQEGWHYRWGPLLVATARLRFGSSGASAGSGNYRVSLPIAASSQYSTSELFAVGHSVGNGVIRDDSATTASRAIAVQLVTSTTVMLVTGSGSQAGSTTPWTWTTDDAITFTAAYLID